MSTPGSPLRIAIVGPESSGKTTLAAALAAELSVRWVPEVARDYLTALGRAYEEPDLAVLARLQLASEDTAYAAAESAGDRFLVCDTNLLVLRVWSEVVYGRVDPWIVENLELESYALHLLTAPDLSWAADPLREAPSPADREALFERYRDALSSAGASFTVVRGRGDARTQAAVDAVLSLSQ